jgi:type IV secretory pathway VirB2 component (pilin)
MAMATTKRTFYLAINTPLGASALLLFLLCAAAGPLEASTAMPWEGPMCAVAASLKDQVAVMLSVVATIMIGIMFMYSETGGIVARIGGWLLGLSCALSVASIITALFPGVSIPGCL